MLLISDNICFLSLKSSGYDDTTYFDDSSYIKVENETILTNRGLGNGRGWNIAIIEQKTCVILQMRQFDVIGELENVARMAEYLRNARIGTIVAATVSDSAATYDSR